jgi:flagellar motor switch protein FliM
MKQTVENAALRRMLHSPPPAPASAPLPSRLFRQAAIRAADRGAALPLVVLGVELGESSLDDLVTGLDPGHLLVMIGGRAGAEGVVVLDPEIVAALIEMQTVGRLLPQPALHRDPTTADLAMAEPFAHHLLSELRTDTEDAALAETLAGMGVLGRFANRHAVALALPDGRYRMVRLSLDIGLPERQAGLLLALPLRSPTVSVAATPVTDPAWSAALRRVVLDSPCRLDAILHRLTMTLGAVEAFTVGQVLPLPGVTVASVRLESPGGALVGPGKLGQMGGMRAVRLVTPRPPQLEDMLPAPAITQDSLVL